MPTKTFLFVDQVGSTEQLTALGDAAAHEVRRALFDLLRQATEVAGGHEVDFTGDGLFCAFDGAADAVAAAVAMQQLAHSFNRRRTEALHLAVRIGLHSGEPLESEGGGYFGTAVVVAARLCTAAAAGQVLCSALVRDLAEPRGSHRFEPVGPLALKGVPEHVVAWAVEWAPDDRRARLPPLLGAARSTALVGRVEELRAVESAWADVTGGDRRLVLVSGDRGSGVTRLLAEAAQRLHDRGASVWAGQAQGGHSRLAPWAQAVGMWAATTPRAELRLALGDRAADLQRLLPGLADLVPRLPAPAPVDAAAEVFLIGDALDEVVTRWSAIEPLVVVIDDLERADAATLGVQRRLATSRRGGRVLLLAGYEPSAVGTPAVFAALRDVEGLVDLRLGGLAPDEVRELVGAVTGAPVDAATLAAVLGESEGSPWFVLQMARSLRERGLAQEVRHAVDRAGELRTDLRLQREEVHLALRQLEQLRVGPEPADGQALDPDGTPPAPGTSPYRGLLPYQQEDAAAFHGRDGLVADMIATLLSSRWLAVVGPSGSGKSSAVRAGLLPALARGALPDSASWASSVCAPGPQPLVSIARAVVEGAGGEVGSTAERLGEQPWATLAEDLLGDRRLVLVVDQFEELWTSCSPADRARVLDLLVDAASDPRGRLLVVVCLRADYYGHAAGHSAFAGLLSESQVLVAPMTTSELRAAVERPALDAGLVLEPGLSQAVVDDVAGEPGALPLLSTAMAETWERRRGRSLTLAGYAETGGARRAIAGLAETTLAALGEQEQQVARRLLLRLAAPTAEGGDVARPALLAELRVDAQTSRVLAHLAERRLVIVGGSTARVAHEALLREWPRLQTWLEEDREGRRLHQQVASAAVQWHEGGRDDGGLLRGARLAAADDWRAEHDDELTGVEREFLAASAEARQRELRAARRTTRRFQVLAGALVLLLLGVLAAGGLAVARGRQAEARATEATARGLAAQAIALTDTRLDTALLLAAEGYRADPSVDTETGVLSALEGARHVAAYRHDLSLDSADLALTEDRTVLAVLTQAGEVRLLDAESLRPLGGPLVRGLESPYVVAISPSGETVGYSDATGVHLVDRATGEEVLPALGGGAFASLSFSSDGTAVVVAGGPDEPGITITDLGTAERRGAIPDEGFGQAVVRPGADEVLVAREQAPLQRYRLDGTALGEPLPVRGSLAPMLYTSDGSRLVQTSPGGTTRVYDAETFELVGEPVASTGSRIVDLAVSPDGASMALSGDDGSVKVVGVEDGAVLGEVEGLSGAHAVVFRDEQSVLASSQAQSVELDLGELTALGTTTALPEVVGHLAVLPDGDTVLAGQGRELVEVGPGRAVVPTGVELPVTVNGPLAVSPDGTRVAVQGTPAGVPFDAGAERQLVVADRRSGAVLVRTQVAGDEQTPLPGRLAFSPDGQRLAVGTFGGVLTVLDSTSGDVLLEERVDEAAVGALRWSADGEVLYEGGQDGVLRFLDAATAEVLEEVPLTPGFALSDIAGVPGTTLLAVASEAGEVVVVDPVAREVVGERLSAEGTQLLGVAVSPDGDRVAGITRDGSLRLWLRRSGRLVGPALHGHRADGFGIAWTDTGRLVTASGDGSVITWDTEQRRWSAAACRIAGRDLTAAEWQRYLPERPYRRTCSAS